MEWYIVEFDEEKIIQRVSPPGEESWTQELLWSDIIRVCFEQGEFLTSDSIYIFTNQRAESYIIPTEAIGGPELWGEIINRDLFDADLAIKAATGEGGIYCWPPVEEKA